MYIITHRKLFYTTSGILMLASLVSLAFWGLKPSIDFTGGTLLEVEYTDSRPDQSVVLNAMKTIDETVSVRQTGERGYIIRMKSIDNVDKSKALTNLALNGTKNVVEKRFDSIGPLLGIEALRKSLISIAMVILGIVLYITFAFRHVSEPISSWKYGLVAIIALVHDVIIPTGLFSILGHFVGYEVDTLFVTALLVILGFSVHDTIVVFDRVRENLKNSSNLKNFEIIVGNSISQTLTRSINTSLTTLIALIVLYFAGGVITQHFALTLIVGIAAGTYSSIFVGSPLLVTFEKLQKKNFAK